MPEDGIKLFLMNQDGMKTVEKTDFRRPRQTLTSFCASVVKKKLLLQL
tara:strand:- start:14 stop:157 length:144 start_codon:yes stop_codon:yes gene_type:complete